MKKMSGIIVLIAVALFAAGCGGKGNVEAKGSVKDPVKAAVVQTTTTTEAPVVTTTTEAPTTTTTAAPSQEKLWLDNMAAVTQKFLDANAILQHGNNDAVTCRQALAVYNTVKVADAPKNPVTQGSGDYVLVAKYQREALSSFKESMNNCIAGDLSYMLRYMQLGNEWLQLASDNLD